MIKRRSKQSGAAFITALIIVTVLTMIVTAFSTRLNNHLKTETLRIEDRQAEQMARSAVARALVSINLADQNYSNSSDEWWTLGNTGQDVFKVGNNSFRLQILDAGAFVNLNTITQASMQRLGWTDEQIDSLLDWREAGQTARTSGGKDQYYNQLSGQYYNARLADFQTVDEIFLVKGFTPEFLLNPLTNVSGSPLVAGNVDTQPAPIDLLTVGSLSRNVNAQGQGRVNVNTAQVQQLQQAGLDPNTAQAIVTRRNTVGTFANLGAVLQTPGMSVNSAGIVLNALTTSNGTTLPGRINLNTASEAVLNTLPNISSSLVQDILSRQGTIQSLDELASFNGVDLQQLEDFADSFTVNTQAYIVRVEGIAGSARYRALAFVQIVNGVPTVMRMQQPLYPDVLTRWGWPDTGTNEIDLVQNQ